MILRKHSLVFALIGLWACAGQQRSAPAYEPSHALCGVYSGTEPSDEGGPYYASATDHFEAHRWQEAARAFTAAADHYADPPGEVGWRANRWASYSAAALSWLYAGEVERARRTLLSATTHDLALAAALRRAAAALPSPPDCALTDILSPAECDAFIDKILYCDTTASPSIKGAPRQACPDNRALCTLIDTGAPGGCKKLVACVHDGP